MWNVRGDDPIYPVVDFGRPGTIIGDLIMTDDVETFWDVNQMEQSVGYILRQIDVEFPDDPVTVEAWAFHWPLERRGAWVPSGDWIGWSNERKVAMS